MKIWSFIQKELSNNKNVVLITVVERNGSSPGIVGFKMAVSQTGEMEGSIGGGVMEYKMSELAKSIAVKENTDSFIKKQIHNPDAGEDQSGLICSGEQTHAFIQLYPSHLEIINQIISTLDQGKTGQLNINHKGISFDANKKTDSQFYFNFISDENWEYQEKIGLKDTVYIFGAGHISLPLSQICRMLDFKVIVLDDREDLSTYEKNDFAHQKKIVDFKNIKDIVPENEHSFVVIMTVAHKSDAIILKQLAGKKIKYLGMIGSKNKVKSTYDLLMNEGISEEDLKKTDAPIGVPIKCKTTTEIAISIAAKIIDVRNC